MTEPKPAIKRLRRRKARHQQRGRLYRVSFAVAGVVVIVGGLALSLPGVPGPGLVLVAVGLGMLALESERAERLLERILDRLERARNAGRVQKVLYAVALALAAAGAVAAAILWEIPLLPG